LLIPQAKITTDKRVFHIMRRQNVIEECAAGNVGKVARSLFIVENGSEERPVQ